MPCYSFNKVCVPDSGLDFCSQAAGSSCGSTVTWFWLLAALVGGAVVVANMGKS